jgi:hypothetical protein
MRFLLDQLRDRPGDKAARLQAGLIKRKIARKQNWGAQQKRYSQRSAASGSAQKDNGENEDSSTGKSEPPMGSLERQNHTNHADSKEEQRNTPKDYAFKDAEFLWT